MQTCVLIYFKLDKVKPVNQQFSETTLLKSFLFETVKFKVMISLKQYDYQFWFHWETSYCIQFWPDSVIRPVSIRSRKCCTQMVTNGKCRKTSEKLNWPIIRCFPKTDESWIDYIALIEVGLSSNIDEPCNLHYSLKDIKENAFQLSSRLVV